MPPKQSSVHTTVRVIPTVDENSCHRRKTSILLSNPITVSSLGRKSKLSSAKTGEMNLAFVVQSPSSFSLGSWLVCILISPRGECLALPPLLVCVVARVGERKRSKVELDDNSHGGGVIIVE